MRPGSGLILLAMLMASLAGCRGYVADRLKPRSSFVAPQLTRYGISGEPATCVEQRLTKDLDIWQLRQFRDLAGRLSTGGENPATLHPWDLVYVAGLVRDAEVAQHVRDALGGCGVALAPPPPVSVVATPAPGSPDASSPPASAAVSSSGADSIPLWVNLGAAASGQGIAVDARSVTREAGARQAWFRLLRITGDQIVGETGYLLRVDCAARTVTAHAGRTYGADGVVVQQKDYEKPDGPLAIEGGTVIEVAYHALCDEAK